MSNRQPQTLQKEPCFRYLITFGGLGRKRFFLISPVPVAAPATDFARGGKVSKTPPGHMSGTDRSTTRCAPVPVPHFGGLARIRAMHDTPKNYLGAVIGMNLVTSHFIGDIPPKRWGVQG
jgi:hypothetical protein